MQSWGMMPGNHGQGCHYVMRYHETQATQPNWCFLMFSILSAKQLLSKVSWALCFLDTIHALDNVSCLDDIAWKCCDMFVITYKHAYGLPWFRLLGKINLMHLYRYWVNLTKMVSILLLVWCMNSTYPCISISMSHDIFIIHSFNPAGDEI